LAARPAAGGEVVFDVLSDRFTTPGADGALLLDDPRVE